MCIYNKKIGLVQLSILPVCPPSTPPVTSTQPNSHHTFNYIGPRVNGSISNQRVNGSFSGNFSNVKFVRIIHVSKLINN